MNVPFNVTPAPKKKSKAPKLFFALALLIALIVFVSSTCTSVVPTGYTGILTTFGRVADYTLDAGFHFKSPFQQVTLMDNREQKTAFTTMAFSSDIQQVDVQGSINYNINIVAIIAKPNYAVAKVEGYVFADSYFFK